MFMLKMGIFIGYFLLTFFFPSLGIPTELDFLLELTPILICLFSLLFLRKELIAQWKKINGKELLVVTSIFIILSITSSSLLSFSNTSIELSVTKIPWWFILQAISYGPFVEEIVYRYCLIPLNKNIGLTVLWMFFSALLFAVDHGGNFTMFILGILFGCLYYWKRNMWYALIPHLANNLLALMIYLFSLSSF